MKNRLKEIRKEKKLTQSELADLCDSSLQMIQYLENGQRQITPKWMDIFSKALKIEPWELWVPSSIIEDKTEKELWILERYRAAPDAIRDIVDKALEMVEK